LGCDKGLEVTRMNQSRSRLLQQLKHVRVIAAGRRPKARACGECRTSCQSACKTSCTVGNVTCERT